MKCIKRRASYLVISAYYTFECRVVVMSKEKYPMLDLFERTLDLVCIVDKGGWFKKINPSVIDTLDYTEKELFDRPVSELIHPDDREITAGKRAQLLNSTPLLNFQNRYITKSGAIVWLEWTSVYIPEKEVVFAIAKDITKRKKVEIEIEENYKKYKILASHFKKHVEVDRQNLATELHEQLAQIATVIKMDIELVASQNQQLNEFSLQRLNHAMSTCELLINKIRRLSYSISPSRIEELGLETVLRSLCDEFSEQTGIPCNYKSSYNEEDLEYEVKLDLLRICQEALLNVMRHAQATRVHIKLEEKNNKIELSIIDNGKGFHNETTQRFGLRNMHGRAASINGSLQIKSKQKQGTSITVSVDTRKA
jgi:PAS domain S-box-containing protein